MLSAAMTLAFFRFLQWRIHNAKSNAYQPHRHLSMQDVIFYPTMEEAAYMTIRFKYSKPDPFGKGHTVTLHATNTLTCPVQAMRHYLKLRSYHAQSLLFLLADGMVLTRFKFVTSLRCLLTKAGLQAELHAGHSFKNWGSHDRCHSWSTRLVDSSQGEVVFRVLQTLHTSY